MIKKPVNVIGAGLSGCEAAWQLAQRNIPVRLFEKKTQSKNEIQKLDTFGELVCSNSLRSDELSNAVGVLKREMEAFHSLILQAARAHAVPAGKALAVDREGFSNYITKQIRQHPLIEVADCEFQGPFRDDEVYIVASGPLTSPALQSLIQTVVGPQDFYFYDAVAPIVTKGSINFDIAYYKSRYADDEASQDYINCPMNEEQFNTWVTALLGAERAPLHDFETEKVFEGCMPVEVMAARNPKALLFGPLKPRGLHRVGYPKNYAVVQLRQDNAVGSLYNLVGFQTNLTWPEQDRVIHMIPGLEAAQIVRHGVMHKNNYLNTPKLLTAQQQLVNHPNIFFVGQITGIEGYVESSASGIMGAIHCARYLNGLATISWPRNSIMGALAYYIQHADPTNFQPMKANFGLVELANQRFGSKQEKYAFYAQRALTLTTEFIQIYNLDFIA